MATILPPALGLAAVLLCQRAVIGAAQRPAADGDKHAVVVMLGTGTPRPLPDVWGPATAVVVGSRVFLVDVGVGVERRLAAAGLPTDGVTAAFITHLHSDHVLGLSDLIFTSWVMGRTRPFPVYGPPWPRPHDRPPVRGIQRRHPDSHGGPRTRVPRRVPHRRA